MAIPDYQTIMLPLMKYATDGKQHALGEAREYLANLFKLSEQERRELLPSGIGVLFNNRVSWALLYLVKAGLLEYAGRGFFKITKRGSEVIAQNPPTINVKFLDKYPEFLAFRRPSARGKPQVIKPHSITDQTPIDSIEDAYQRINEALSQELLAQVKKASPDFFERMVVELLVKMGYGGSIQDAGKAIGRAGDGGIDGIIKEDKLGLDTIYIQAKRWENSVGSPELQKFAGALQGRKARKGVFITTSKFTKEALDFASTIENKIVTIDGERLAELMTDYGIGVAETASYKIRRVDLDYFAEE